ncbi:hypothetical protein [Rhodopila sp.]|uniref:hypothetical protein n=1 Tax=Rhodopila sp. TaxID=2480087 RepID=UPI003D119C18
MSVSKRLGMAAAVVGLAAVGVAAMPHDAEAWWRGGYGVGVVVPPVVVAPAPVYPPPVVVAPGYGPPRVAYAPRRFWVPPHWEGRYWVRGHWG